MKRRVIKGVILGVIFIAALVISSFVLNRGVEDEIVDMGGGVSAENFFCRGWQGCQYAVWLCG